MAECLPNAPPNAKPLTVRCYLFKDMLDINDIIELKSTTSDGKLSFATRYLVQVNFTFDLTIISETFSGTAHFCVRKDEIENLCENLRQMMISLKGNARLDDNDSDAFIQFSINSIGRIFISGQIGGSHDDNFMQYKFSTDKIETDDFFFFFSNLLLYVDDAEYEKEYNRLYRQK